ncbi:cysteine hydrolase family protein [Rossellomorea aquimaris]|uniref:cysteine hydrolase family protein n=1 Tax=Rossellomorea aquimaris TaxID=189382 RepID=UPI0005C83873|nr:cysteine hydrolase family protein [Rossellomorea aquimaris]
MKTALLIIDVQNGMFTVNPPVCKGNALLKRIKRALGFAKNKNIPIIYVQHSGPKDSPLEKGTMGWNFHEDISPADGDIIVHKDTPDSFYRTNLQQKLRELNIDHLVLTGIQTEACIDTTCRRGFSLDFKITILTDAHSTFDKKEISAAQIISHHNEVLRWFADTITTDDFINE